MTPAIASAATVNLAFDALIRPPPSVRRGQPGVPRRPAGHVASWLIDAGTLALRLGVQQGSNLSRAEMASGSTCLFQSSTYDCPGAAIVDCLSRPAQGSRCGC